jgi:hypothetical protein
MVNYGKFCCRDVITCSRSRISTPKPVPFQQRHHLHRQQTFLHAHQKPGIKTPVKQILNPNYSVRIYKLSKGNNPVKLENFYSTRNACVQDGMSPAVKCISFIYALYMINILLHYCIQRTVTNMTA